MAETFTLATFLTDVGSFVTSAITWMGSLMTFIVSQPVLLATVLIGFVSLAVGLVLRMIRM